MYTDYYTAAARSTTAATGAKVPGGAASAAFYIQKQWPPVPYGPTAFGLYLWLAMIGASRRGPAHYGTVSYVFSPRGIVCCRAVAGVGASGSPTRSTCARRPPCAHAKPLSPEA